MIDIEYFKQFDTIVVTGPQRSGTRICANILAHDLNYTYIDESRFDNCNVVKFFNIINSCVFSPIVIQCPDLSYMCHAIPDKVKCKFCVVFMFRPVAEINASQQKVGLTDRRLLRNYKNFIHLPYKGMSACEVKYYVWKNVQKKLLEHAVDINYYDLHHHSMWVPNGQRIDWEPHQIANEQT